MKIRMELDENLKEEEIVIRCNQLSEEVIALQKQMASLLHSGMQLMVTKADTDYFLDLQEILFLETDGAVVAVHTKDAIYNTKQRLYELESLLPREFVRVSKSAIINSSRIRAIHKNITGASEVEFSSTDKKAFVSRNYYKSLIHMLEEKRLKL